MDAALSEMADRRKIQLTRALLLLALIGCLFLSGCGYSVVEDKLVLEIGTGDTYVAPRSTAPEDIEPALGEE